MGKNPLAPTDQAFIDILRELVEMSLAMAVLGISGTAGAAYVSPLHITGRSMAGGVERLQMSEVIRPVKQPAATSAMGILLATSMILAPVFGVSAADLDQAGAAGFEEFAAAGGKMKADPSCFFDQCSAQTQACFTNPACLKGITCLGNCRGEQVRAAESLPRANLCCCTGLPLSPAIPAQVPI